MTGFAIETHDLGKTYGDVVAVDELGLRVEEGEIYAFLGLNGAGKTTTIRMLLGMIKPTTGYANVLGTRVHMSRKEPWKSVGYLVEVPQSYPELSVAENLEVARRLHPGTPRSAIGRIIELTGLSPYAHRPARHLSHGNAQRLGLAKALLHHPRLLLLDEPANGLDPSGIVEIRELLLDLAHNQGLTIFMTSHILAEVARLADRVGIIHQGHLLQEMDAGAMEERRKRRLLIRTRDPELARRTLEAAGIIVKPGGDGVIQLEAKSAIRRPDEINALLVRAGASPIHLAVQEEELERYFLRLVGLNGGPLHGRPL
jgi:ABC-2 type transport system ATP-binding protein